MAKIADGRYGKDVEVNAGQLSCSSKRMRRRFVVATGSPAASEFRRYCLLLPFVPYLSNPRTLFSRELFRRFPVVPVVVLARARLLPESSGFLAGLVVAQFKYVRASDNTALSSPCWDRSHHEPSGNPGSTAGRGFNPAGGSPGGG
ncbi:hypothetical protein F511_27205 [Dorcoceras hygrometricum]|uniref:Uncharacterized protein n=1 Tax=Dorcoceras hygrometricum TaxID=472368 RepID=A0A2Z7BK42_9LAMI|nr:hypothetical protein F511_27205 [Dorcoceras hygrometricum]